jgi:hypothetical protein
MQIDVFGGCGKRVARLANCPLLGSIVAFQGGGADATTNAIQEYRERVFLRGYDV